MLSALAQAIRDARFAVRLTQKQLAGRLGMTERAVHRWEQHGRIPRRTARAALLREIRLLDPVAADALAAAFASAEPPSAIVRVEPVAASSPSPMDTQLALELALLALAEELEVPPRRARLALGRWHQRLHAASVPLEAAARQVGVWTQSVKPQLE